MTGRIIIDLFTTLDWVAQAPGAPDEDTSGGFPFGGWQAPLPSEAVGRRVEEGMKTLDALLLGRRTYDIFAGYWPHHTTGPEGFIGRLFDRVPEYVASRNRDLQPGWQGSTRIGDDLVQTLLRERLYDVLNLWLYPVVLGTGRKVFPDGAAPGNLRLLDATSGDGGTLLLRYAPAKGEVATGTMGS